MKKFISLFALVLVLAPVVHAQTQQIEHYIITYNGDRFVGEKLEYESPIMKGSKFNLANRTFESTEVQYFRNNHGVFGNLRHLYGDKSERYALRITAGKMNLFEEIDFEYYAEEQLAVGENGDPSSNENLASGEYFQFYAMGEGPIKKASYKNMKMDMADNALALKELKMVRRYSILQFGMGLAAAGILTYDLIQQSDDRVRFSPLIAASIIVGGSTYFIQGTKDNARWLAADAYNKN